ncbi:MAG: relaxase/mobilization nuclease domain-containing protein, partial [Pseudobutyrivibrio sp.]|nr:relaxase/mobilization nuclease domain-containing protein [Pseudobutyrivibrio sp.]
EYKGDIIAYQIRQSFKPGEITPEEANQIGYETVMRFTKGEHAFIVCTHTDKAHIHNHVIFNSVNLDCDRKFRDSWFCAIGLRRLSDMICLEHGLSVIKPYQESRSKPKYEKSRRQEIREEIDKVLEQKPQNFQQFLKLLEEDEYEIKKGKYLAIREKDKKNFIRMKSLGAGYSEEEIKDVIEGKTKHQKSEPKYVKREFDLLIDIQEKLRAGKGEGYATWCRTFNNKAIMKTWFCLEQRGIHNYEELAAKAEAASTKFSELTDTIKAAEKSMSEIAALRQHIYNYAKTRDVYVAYRKAGYSKKFFEEHREEITLHRAAKEAFKKLDGDIPKVKDLNAEYAKQLQIKKQAYSEYKAAKQEMKELVEAKNNIDLFNRLDRERARPVNEVGR